MSQRKLTHQEMLELLDLTDEQQDVLKQALGIYEDSYLLPLVIAISVMVSLIVTIALVVLFRNIS